MQILCILKRLNDVELIFVRPTLPQWPGFIAIKRNLKEDLFGAFSPKYACYL